jgi:hypothetical protein
MSFNENAPTLYIYRGLPGSGKSTDARQFVAERAANSNYQKHTVIVERDLIRRELSPSGEGWYVHDFEAGVTKIQDERITLNLKAGNDVINSDTNLPNPNAKRVARVGVNAGANVEFVEFRDVDLVDCLNNNERRKGTDKYVDPSFIKGAHERFIAGKALSHPTPPEPAKPANDLVGEKYVATPWGIPTVLVDLDGTLADHNGRDPYDESKYSEDLISGNVLDLVLGLHSLGYRIDIVTGRHERYRDVCLAWLAKYNIPYVNLHMRPGPGRDDKVKLDLFEANYRNNPELAVQFCIDDRDRVVSMYRNVLGLQVMQVAEGNF